MNMKSHLLLFFALLCFKSAHGYSKYGRSCKDIGCASNEECIMAETPCSYQSRENECGLYPTCKRISNSAPSCATYICPPTKKCIVEGSDAKCVDDDKANIPGNQNGNKAYQSYDTQNTNDQPSAPNPNPNPVYPVLPGQTTTRPPIRRPGYNGGGGGYQGGSVGSGYPAQSGGGYQGGSVGSGYPGQGGGGYQGGGVGSGYPGQGRGGYQGGSVGSGYPGQAGGGYQGGAAGSGYPGQAGGGYQGGAAGSGYPGQAAGGYQGGAAGSGYPGQGSYQGRYPQQAGGYQQPGYGYQPGYQQPGRGGYNYNQQRPPQQSSGSNPLYDTLKNTLSSYGTSLLKNALGNIKF